MSMLMTAARRLRTNWQDPEIRRHVGWLFLGKAIGLAIVLTLMTRWFLPAVLGAQAPVAAPAAAPAAGAAAAAAPVIDTTTTINAINTVWVLVAAFLVF